MRIIVSFDDEKYNFSLMSNSVAYAVNNVQAVNGLKEASIVTLGNYKFSTKGFAEAYAAMTKACPKQSDQLPYRPQQMAPVPQSPSFAEPDRGSEQGVNPAPSQPFSQAPAELGSFGDWIAATSKERLGLRCYAFTHVKANATQAPHSSQMIMSVRRQTFKSGPVGTSVLIESGGFTASDGVVVLANFERLKFIVNDQGGAFAANSASAVAALQRASIVIVIGFADTFSLNGFSGAYAAISKACPGR